MKCAICDRPTRYLDRRTGEYLCGLHCRVSAGRADEPRAPVREIPDPNWVALKAALEWNYGPTRAASILAGTDFESNRDQWLWKRLGSAWNYGSFR